MSDAAPITANAAARAAELVIDRAGLRLCGVHYSWEFFHAMGARLAPGTHLDVAPIEGGKYLLHHFKPGGTPHSSGKEVQNDSTQASPMFRGL